MARLVSPWLSASWPAAKWVRALKGGSSVVSNLSGGLWLVLNFGWLVLLVEVHPAARRSADKAEAHLNNCAVGFECIECPLRSRSRGSERSGVNPGLIKF